MFTFLGDIAEISLITVDAAGVEHTVSTDGEEMIFQEGEERKVRYGLSIGPCSKTMD